MRRDATGWRHGSVSGHGGDSPADPATGKLLFISPKLAVSGHERPAGAVHVCCTGRADGPERARVLASAFHWATVWIGCALGACLTAGCASPGQLSESSGRGSPPACACQSNVAEQSKPKNGTSKPAAPPAPHTVGQAWRAYVNCLHSPLSRRGPSMKVQEGTGDTGLSRYPPAEGERYSRAGPATNVGEGRSDTGVSSFPPAEGERNASGRGTETTHGRRANRGGWLRQPAGPNGWGWHASGSERPQGQRRSRKADSACAGDDSFPGERCLSVSLLQFDWPAADRASCHVDDRHAVPGGCAPGIRKRRRSRYLRFRYAWR